MVKMEKYAGYRMVAEDAPRAMFSGGYEGVSRREDYHHLPTPSVYTRMNIMNFLKIRNLVHGDISFRHVNDWGGVPIRGAIKAGATQMSAIKLGREPESGYGRDVWAHTK